MNSFSTEEFLQGFLEEASEHLARSSQNLLVLEQGDDLERVELLSELFRSFHTLKGLCGMVNLVPGAQLSHAMENVLRGLQEEALFPTQIVIDRLLEGTRLLSTVVDSVRGPGRPLPDVAPQIQILDALLHGTQETPETGLGSPQDSEQEILAAPPLEPAAQAPSSQETASLETATGQTESSMLEILPELASYPDIVRALTPLDQRKISAAAQAGQSFAVARFSPSHERAERGENVDMIRERLQQAGTLIKAIPAILAGQVSFLFLLASAQQIEAGSTLADEIIPLTVRLPNRREPTVSHPSAPAAPSRTTVRVDLARLDDLIRFTGDLILLRWRLTNNLNQLEGAPVATRRDLGQVNQQMGRALRDLRRAILRARMVPLAETFNHMPLVARDLARASQKEVHLVIRGETTEVDKALVERLLDPLIHLVRNAITHGIEPPSERTALGKPPYGTLTLQGFPEGDHIRVEVTDDGRGVDLARVAEKAAAMGLREPDAPLNAAEALDIITRAGFSTQGEANMAAGRGVGLDVVHRMVRSFGGQMEMDTVLGQGTTFRLRLPLTLVIMDTLFVLAGGQQYAVPQDAVERIIEVDPRQIIRAESGELLPGQDSYFVVHRLSAFGAPQSAGMAVSTGTDGLRNRAYGLIGQSQARREEAGSEVRQLLLVDAVQDLREVVVHTLADPLVTRPGIGGATEMGDGRVVLILDLPSLFQTLRKDSTITSEER